MTSKEAILHQLKNLKGKPLKQKIEHILTYFWIPILIVLVLLFSTGSYIVHRLTMKDIALSVNCINAMADAETAQAYIDAFADAAGIDREKYVMQISAHYILDDKDLASSYNTTQVIVSQIAAGATDILAGDRETMLGYCYQEFFQPLDAVLTAQQLEAHKDAFLYIDMALVRQIQENFIEEMPEFPDPTKPEEMAEPMAIALRVPEDSPFRIACFPYRKNDVVLGLAVNSENLANAVAFMEYVMEYE